MDEECLLGDCGELIDAVAGGVEPLDQREGLLAHGLFDLGQLVEVVRAEDVPKPLDLCLDAAARSVRALEQRAQLAASEFGGDSRGGRGTQHHASVPRVESWIPGTLEGEQGGRVELTEMGSKSVGHLLPIPDRVLVGPGERGDGLPGLAVVGQGSVGVPVRPKSSSHDLVEASWSG